MGNRSPIFGTPQAPQNMFGLTPEAIAQRRKQRQFQGVSDTLTQLGIGLMGRGPSMTPQGPLQGLAEGLQGANQMMGQRQDQNMQQDRADMSQAQFGMQQQQFQAEQKKQAEQDAFAQARQAQMEKLISGLPPEQQAAARADPDTFFKAYAEAMFPKEQGPQSAIAKAQADLKAGRMSQAEYDAYVRKETYIQPPDQTNINMPVETAFAKSFGGAEGEAAGKLANDVGSQASAQLQNLQALQQAYSQLQAAGGDTNAMASLKLKATQIAQGLGMDPASLGLPQNAGPGETINAITNQLALQMRNPAGGAGMPGAMSDADRQFLSQTVPNIDNSPQGFQAKIEISQKVAQRNAEMSARWNAYPDQSQAGFRKFKQEWKKYTDANPLFGQQDRQKLNSGVTIGAPKGPTVTPDLNPEDGWQ